MEMLDSKLCIVLVFIPVKVFLTKELGLDLKIWQSSWTPRCAASIAFQYVWRVPQGKWKVDDLAVIHPEIHRGRVLWWVFGYLLCFSRIEFKGFLVCSGGFGMRVFIFVLCSSAENEWEGNWIYDEGWRSYSLFKWSDEQAECYKGMTWKDRFSLINDERQKQWRDRLYEQSVGWRRWSSYICIYALRPTCAPVGAAMCVEQIPYKKFKGKGMSASSSFIRFYVENLGNHKSKCVTTVFCSYFSQPQSSRLSHRSWNNGFFIM